MSDAVLELIDINRTYRTAAGELPVLKGTNLRLNAGELVGLVGPSGSGKSTLLRCINFLEEYQEGICLPVPPPASRVQCRG